MATVQTDREFYANWLAELLRDLARDADALADDLRNIAEQARAVPTKAAPDYTPLACRALREVQRMAATPELPLIIRAARDADLAQAAEVAGALDAAAARPLTTVVRPSQYK
jgi:hypothetical protein